MPSVEDYRQRLATLQGSWDTLSLLSHLSGDGTDMGATRQAFEALAADLVRNLADETHRKALLGLQSASQIAIDVLVRNLFERTADIGFLSTDDNIREFALACGAANAQPADPVCPQARWREYVAKYSVYDDVVLLSPDGEVLARLDERHGVTRCEEPFVGATLASRAGHVATYGPTTLFPDRARTLLYSHRVLSGSRTLGVLCLSFRFDDEVAGIFAKLCKPRDWHVVAFLDAVGTVLASSDPWQMPTGAIMPLALHEGGSIIRFAGREYLAITRRTQGYQGYLGPGWYGHAMIPLEHAFDRDAAQPLTIAERVLADLRDSDAVFSNELQRIPLQADEIQRDLNRAVWNGNVRLAQHTTTNNNFAKVLLWEIGNAGRRTQETFERSMGDLQKTVISAILHDAQQFASLAVDVLDRNLYERANDCRWWALHPSLSAPLAPGMHDPEPTASILRHINSLYTAYHDIVVFDTSQCIRAVSNLAHTKRIGQSINEPWASATLALRNSQDCAASDFRPSTLYHDEHALIFGAALRNRNGRCVGGIGIVFDTKPQLTAMLRDALPRTESGECTPGCIGMFIDANLRVIATTGSQAIGSMLDLPGELLADSQEGRIVTLGDIHYAMGSRRSSGYREYAGLGVTAMILIPLGSARSPTATTRRASRQMVHRLAADSEAVVDIATFRSAQQWFGLMRDQVIEAIDGSSRRAVPGAPAWHAGLLMYRGEPVPVVDLARLIDRQCAARGRDVVIARAGPHSPPLGILVDELDDIPELPANRILPVAEFAQRNGPSIIDRAVRPNKPDDPMLFLVNLEQVLQYARLFADASR